VGATTTACRRDPPAVPALRQRVAALTEEHAAWWAATPTILPALGPRSGIRRHIANARAAARLVDALAGEATRVPDDPAEREAWRQSVRERLQEFGDRRLGWPSGYRRLVFAEDFFAVSREFARAARQFDPGLRLADLWQALRNVWIGNSLQMLLDRPLVLGEGLFAYSMLYPLTDNLLDDPQLDRRAKREFGERFGERLGGMPVRPASAREAAVFALVGRVEDEFPRPTFPDVHESLLAIHDAQMLSLRQHAGPALGSDELLAISCEKGGTSVLADLHLVAGATTPVEERFGFGYGVFLQLLDDLQDVESDLAAGHHTLFSVAASRGPLDEPTARLARFMNDVLDASPLLAPPEAADRKDLIRRNCTSLLVGAVAEQPRRFSGAFRRAVARQWPLSLRAMRRLRRRAENRFGAAARALEERTGGGSLLDWALAQSPSGDPAPSDLA
jgi:hypothetical protein